MDWRTDPTLCKVVVDAYHAGHRGPLFSRWHIVPIAKRRIRAAFYNAHKIDFDVHSNNPAGVSPTNPTFYPPLRLSMLFDEGDADANTGWFAIVSDRVTGEQVALANGFVGDSQTGVKWISEKHLARYRQWGDVPTSLWSREIFNFMFDSFRPGDFRADLDRPAKNKAEQREWDRVFELQGAAKNFWSVWFCGDSELERLIAVAANIDKTDLPDPNIPDQLLPRFWGPFLRAAFEGTVFGKLPGTAIDRVALYLDRPVVYTKGLFPVDSNIVGTAETGDEDLLEEGEIDLGFFESNLDEFRVKLFRQHGNELSREELDAEFQ